MLGNDSGLAEAIRAEMHGLGISLGAWQSLAMLASGTMIDDRIAAGLEVSKQMLLKTIAVNKYNPRPV